MFNSMRLFHQPVPACVSTNIHNFTLKGRLSVNATVITRLDDTSAR
jgi:hypothetical protein